MDRKTPEMAVRVAVARGHLAVLERELPGKEMQAGHVMENGIPAVAAVVQVKRVQPIIRYTRMAVMAAMASRITSRDRMSLMLAVVALVAEVPPWSVTTD